MPEIQYYLSSENHSVIPHKGRWDTPLPMDRRSADETAPKKKTPVTYKDYFTAVTRFLKKEGFKDLCLAISKQQEMGITADQINRIQIFLVKHGAFYHPSKIRVETKRGVFSFVLNVAVSKKGKQGLEPEVQALCHLQDALPMDFIPRVYQVGREITPSGHELFMFLGQWFEGFHEFHLTLAPKTGKQHIVVWDGNKTPLYLSGPRENALYEKCAMILAAYYNPVSFERIFPWHHAAGDFIVRPGEKDVNVRLVTVRAYEAMGENNSPPTEKDIIESLLTFLIQTSVKLRLDRFDGVGHIAWAEDSAVRPLVEGFFKGLDIASTANGFPDGFSAYFRSSLSAIDPDDLADMTGPDAPSLISSNPKEIRMIHKNLKSHLTALSHAL